MVFDDQLLQMSATLLAHRGSKPGEEFRWSVNLDGSKSYTSNFTSFPGNSAFPWAMNMDNIDHCIPVELILI